MLATKLGVQTSADILDGYKHESPVIDTDVYMFWLRDLVASKGCQFVTARITGNLLDREDELLSFYHGQIIINCTGLGSAELVADTTVYPLRGALIRVINDGRRFPIVKNPLVVAYDAAKRDEDGGIVFIIPRNDRILMLGGEHINYLANSLFPDRLTPHRHRSVARTCPRSDHRQPGGSSHA